MITAEQFRAARAALDITTAAVCAAMQMSPATLVRVEHGIDVRMSTLRKLRAYYEGFGITFTDNGRGVGWQPVRTG